MNYLKTMLISYILLANVSCFSMPDKPAKTKNASAHKVKKAKPTTHSFRPIMQSALRTGKLAGILFGVYVYADQVVKGPQDFTKFPEFSHEDIKKRFRDIITTFHNTKKSLGFTMTEDESIEVASPETTVSTGLDTKQARVEIQGNGNNDRKG